MVKQKILKYKQVIYEKDLNTQKHDTCMKGGSLVNRNNVNKVMLKYISTTKNTYILSPKLNLDDNFN